MKGWVIVGIGVVAGGIATWSYIDHSQNAANANAPELAAATTEAAANQLEDAFEEVSDAATSLVTEGGLGDREEGLVEDTFVTEIDPGDAADAGVAAMEYIGEGLESLGGAAIALVEDGGLGDEGGIGGPTVQDAAGAANEAGAPADSETTQDTATAQNSATATSSETTDTGQTSDMASAPIQTDEAAEPPAQDNAGQDRAGVEDESESQAATPATNGAKTAEAAPHPSSGPTETSETTAASGDAALKRTQTAAGESAIDTDSAQPGHVGDKQADAAAIPPGGTTQDTGDEAETAGASASHEPSGGTLANTPTVPDATSDPGDAPRQTAEGSGEVPQSATQQAQVSTQTSGAQPAGAGPDTSNETGAAWRAVASEDSRDAQAETAAKRPDDGSDTPEEEPSQTADAPDQRSEQTGTQSPDAASAPAGGGNAADVQQASARMASATPGQGAISLDTGSLEAVPERIKLGYILSTEGYDHDLATLAIESSPLLSLSEKVTFMMALRGARSNDTDDMLEMVLTELRSRLQL